MDIVIPLTIVVVVTIIALCIWFTTCVVIRETSARYPQRVELVLRLVDTKLDLNKPLWSDDPLFMQGETDEEKKLSGADCAGGRNSSDLRPDGDGHDAAGGTLPQ